MSDEGFLSRWSRRKRAAEAGAPVAEPVTAVPPAVVAPPPVPAPEEPHFDITSLPSIDSLTSASDFAAFLRKEVPEALKRAALRKAWALDPAIRDFVGPADYAWDYNAPGGVPGSALELGGDIREMLAQVFGPEPTVEGKAPEPVADVVPGGVPLAGSPEAAQVSEPPCGGALPVSPESAPMISSPQDAPMLPPSMVAEGPGPTTDLPATDAGPIAPPVRRHGSALPS
jgi:hypothetical protein